MEKEDDVNDDKRLIDGRANHCAVPEGHHKNQKNLVRLPNSDAQSGSPTGTYAQSGSSTDMLLGQVPELKYSARFPCHRDAREC